MEEYFNTSAVPFWDIAVNGDEGWVCDDFFSALFHVDLKTMEINFVTMLPAEEQLYLTRYASIEYYKGKLVIGPSFEKKAVIYELDSKKIVEIPLEFDVNADDIFWAFQSLKVLGNKAFLLPGTNKKIAVIDLDSYSVSYLEVADIVREKEKSIPKYAFFYKSQAYNGRIVLPSSDLNNLIVLDANEMKVSILQLGKKIKTKVVTLYKDELWAVDDKTREIILFKNNKEELVLNPVNEDIGFMEGFGYRGLIRYGDMLFIFPFKSRFIYTYNLNTKEYKKIYTFPTEFENERFRMGDNTIKCLKQVSDKEVIMYSAYDASILILNMETLEITKNRSFIDNEEKRKINKVLYDVVSKSESFIFYETDKCGVRDLFDII